MPKPFKTQTTSISNPSRKVGRLKEYMKILDEIKRTGRPTSKVCKKKDVHRTSFLYWTKKNNIQIREYSSRKRKKKSNNVLTPTLKIEILKLVSISPFSGELQLSKTLCKCGQHISERAVGKYLQSEGLQLIEGRLLHAIKEILGTLYLPKIKNKKRKDRIFLSEWQSFLTKGFESSKNIHDAWRLLLYGDTFQRSMGFAVQHFYEIDRELKKATKSGSTKNLRISLKSIGNGEWFPLDSFTVNDVPNPLTVIDETIRTLYKKAISEIHDAHYKRSMGIYALDIGKARKMQDDAFRELKAYVATFGNDPLFNDFKKHGIEPQELFPYYSKYRNVGDGWFYNEPKIDRSVSIDQITKHKKILGSITGDAGERIQLGIDKIEREYEKEKRRFPQKKYIVSQVPKTSPLSVNDV